MGAKAVYLAAGGPGSDASKTEEGFREAFRSTGAAHPKVAYIGTANGNNRLFFEYMKRSLRAAGAGEVALAPIPRARTDVDRYRLTYPRVSMADVLLPLVARPGADIDKARRILEDADAVFLAGGEVEDGILRLQNAGLDGFLRELYEGGKLFLGSSAGAIMMGTHWVHWDREGDDATARLFDCLRFVPLLFDTHGESEDWRELKCALRLLGPGAVGYGLAAGGFYSADSSGRLTPYGDAPAVYRNAGGEIERSAWGG